MAPRTRGSADPRRGSAASAPTCRRGTATPSRVPAEGDDRVVALLGAAVGDRLQMALRRREARRRTLSTIVSSTALTSGLKLKFSKSPSLTSGRDLDDRLEDDRLALLALGDLDLRRGERHDVLLAERLPATRPRRADRRLRRRRPRGPSTRSSMTRGALPGRKPGTRVWRDSRPTAWTIGLVQAFGRKLELELET